MRVQLVEAQTHTRLMEQGALTAEETLKQMDTIVKGAVEQVTRVSAAIKTARQAMPLQQSSTTGRTHLKCCSLPADSRPRLAL